MPHSTPSPDENPEAEVHGLLRRQAQALERLATVSDPEYKPRQKVLQRLVAMAVAGGGVVLATYQFAIYVKESYEKRQLISNWVDASREMFEVEGSADEAADMLKHASELDPQDPDVVQASAYVDGMRTVERLMNLDRPFDKADVDAYGRAMGQAVMLQRVAPDAPDWAILRGQLALAAHEPQRAKGFLEQALKIDPKSDFATLRLALVHLDLARASKESTQRQTEFEAARKGLDQAISLNPKAKWAYLWKASVALEVDGKLEDSERFIRTAIELDPRFANAWCTLGELHRKGQQWAKSEDAYARALELRPDLAKALTGLAIVYGSQDKYEIALRYAQRAVAADGNSLLAQTTRGLLAYELAKADTGREAVEQEALYTQAIDAYSKALDLDPRNVDAYVERSGIYRKLKRLQQAGQDARDAVMFGGADPYALNALGKYQAEAGIAAEAVKTFGRVIELDPSFDTAYLDRARARLAMGDTAGAAKDLDDALAKASADFKPNILLERGRMLAKASQLDRALADFVEARKADKELFDAWMEEARALKALGRLAESRAAATEAVQLRPTDKEARQLCADGAAPAPAPAAPPPR